MSVTLVTADTPGERSHDQELNDWLFESSPDCVKLIGLDGSVLAMNRNGMCSMEIDDFASIYGQPWSTLWGSEVQASVSNAIASASGGGIGHFTAFGATIKGTPKWWAVMVTPVRNPQGEIFKLLSVSRDVTEVHQAREMAEASAARFRSVLSEAQE